MTSTVFVDYTTPVPAAWLNDVDTATYTTVPANTAAIATKLDATILHSTTEKATIVDADEGVLVDSAASWAFKKWTFTDLWTWIQTHTSVTYAALAGLSTQVFSVATATAAAHAVRKDQTNVGGDAFSVYLPTADQSLTSNVEAKITLSAETFDLNSKFDSATNYRWTPAAGYYQINWSVYFTGATITDAVSSIRKNGVTTPILYGAEYSGPAITVFNSTGSAFVYMNGSDYLELWGYTVGTTLKAAFSAQKTRFSGVLVRV